MIKKAFNRISTIFKEPVLLLKAGWSFSYVIWNFIWWLSWSIKMHKLNKFAADKKGTYIEKHLLKHYSDIIEKYRTAEESTQICKDFKIWIFWGQGKDKMPDVVKACYNKITENNDNVEFIDMNNVRDFVQLPEIIYEKLENKKLLYAHFSDIVRNSLLAKYGGLWLDVTVYTVDRIPEIATTHTFFSPHDKKNSVYWVSYAMGSNKINSVTFSFVRDILLQFAQKEDVWPEYLLQDRLIGFAHENIPSAKLSIDETPDNNTRRFMLFALMNEAYDEHTYKELIKDNFLFKLSYKAHYKLNCNGEKTFYAQLIANNL
jgi:hypothetical protein